MGIHAFGFHGSSTHGRTNVSSDARRARPRNARAHTVGVDAEREGSAKFSWWNGIGALNAAMIGPAAIFRGPVDPCRVLHTPRTWPRMRQPGILRPRGHASKVPESLPRGSACAF